VNKSLPPSTPPPPSPALRCYAWSWLLTAAVCLAGWFISDSLLESGLAASKPGVHNIYFRLFAIHQQPVLLWLSLFCLAVGLMLVFHRRLRFCHVACPGASGWLDRPLLAPAIIAAVVFLTCSAGTFLIYQQYPLSMDEYLTTWMGELLYSGQAAFSIPAEHRAHIEALTPIFVVPIDGGDAWTSLYLPGYSLLYAAALGLGVAPLLAAALNLCSVLLVASCCRRLYPESSFAPALAAALLATSPHFLVYGMSTYAMSGHLALNLLWLWLYLDSRPWAWLWLPVIGVFAIGLHQPHLHALFVAPFLLRIAFTWPVRRTLYLIAVYTVGCLYWGLWLQWAHGDMGSYSMSYLQPPSAIQILVRLMNVVDTVSWQNPAIFVLLLVAMRRIRRQAAHVRDLCWGILLTFCFFLFTSTTGGHGWGARSIYSILGNEVILAVLGSLLIRKTIREEAKRRLLSLSLAASLLASLCLIAVRFDQVAGFVGRYAQLHRELSEQTAASVLISPESGYYVQDLVRNAPTLDNRPLRFRMDKLTPTQINELRTNGNVLVLDAQRTRQYGLGFIDEQVDAEVSPPPRPDLKESAQSP